MKTSTKLKFTLLMLVLPFSGGVFSQSGWLDATFGDGGITSITAGGGTGGEKIVVQDDGTILVVGPTNDGSGNDIMVIKYLADGTPDATFGTDGVVVTDLGGSDDPMDMAVQTDGKIVVLTRTHLLRYNSDGTLDGTFDTDGWLSFPADYTGSCLGIQSGGKIAVGIEDEYFDPDLFWTYEYALVQLYNDDGSLYSSTSSPESLYWGIDNMELLIQDDDKVIVCGKSDFGGFMFRVNADGSADVTYGEDGTGYDYMWYPILAADFQSDGQIVFISDTYTIYRISTTGILEYVGAASISGIGWSEKYELIVLSEDKILIGHGSSDYSVIRLNSDATLDNTFSSDGIVSIDITGGTSEGTNGLAVQPDGKYLVSGYADFDIATIRIDECTPQTANDSISLCDESSYTWIDGVTYTESNYTATYMLPEGASNGCDSVITLKLTLGTSNSGTDVITACGSHTWIDGITYTADNNTATYTVTNSMGCDSVVTLDLTIDPLPDNGVSLSGITLEADLVDADYQWVDCDDGFSFISGETNQSFTPEANGNYAVIVTEDACSDTSECLTVSSIGVVENDFGAALSVYPNPTNGELSISLGELYTGITVELQTITGQVVQTNNYNNTSNIAYNVEGAAGLYLLKIRSGEGKFVTLRVIKK